MPRIKMDICSMGTIGENAVPVSSSILERFFLSRSYLSNIRPRMGPTMERGYQIDARKGCQDKVKEVTESQQRLASVRVLLDGVQEHLEHARSLQGRAEHRRPMIRATDGIMLQRSLRS